MLACTSPSEDWARHVNARRPRDKGNHMSAIVTFTVDGHDSSELRAALRSKSINVSTLDSPAARLDFLLRNVDQVVRAFVHYCNHHRHRRHREHLTTRLVPNRSATAPRRSPPNVA